MPNGPSKQELEMYWQNSRQYFDELATHYKQADPQYYKEYIEPFYTNPFRGSTQTAKTPGSSTKPILIVVVALVLLFGGLGSAAVFYFLSQDSGTKQKEKYTKQVEEELKKDENI